MSATNNESTTISNTANIVTNEAFTTEEYNPKNNHTYNEDLIDWDPNAPTSHNRSLPQPNQGKDQTAVAKIAGSPIDLANRIQKMNLKRIERAEANSDESMEVDPPPPSLAATQRPPTLSEDEVKIITHRETASDIRVLSLHKKIKILVKEHVAIKKQYKQAQELAMKKTLLHRAQESQKSLQKMIPNKDIEEYVDGWNTWEAKRNLFPPTNRNSSGKKQSSTSKRMRYNDPNRWAEVAEIALAVKGLYDHTRRTC